MAETTEDSDTAAYSNLQHFFANHFNQLLTILVNWSDEEADFAAMIERDCKLNYSGGESVMVTLLKETASNFANCPMLKDNFISEREARQFGQHPGNRRRDER